MVRIHGHMRIAGSAGRRWLASMPLLWLGCCMCVVAGEASPQAVPPGPGTELKLEPQAPMKPVVALSTAHRKMCLVAVGDTMPDMTLVDQNGKDQKLSALRSDKLTVVVFWNAAQRYARAEAMHLQAEVSKPFAKAGVAVIAIHVGTTPKDYDKLVETIGTGVVCLRDPEGKAFAKVATAKLPRTYLLDATGKILWLDLEYSRSTRFDLNNALRYYTQPAAAPKK